MTNNGVPGVNPLPPSDPTQPFPSPNSRTRDKFCKRFGRPFGIVALFALSAPCRICKLQISLAQDRPIPSLATSFHTRDLHPGLNRLTGILRCLFDPRCRRSRWEYKSIYLDTVEARSSSLLVPTISFHHLHHHGVATHNSWSLFSHCGGASSLRRFPSQSGSSPELFLRHHVGS
jgi:hypothetical protein